MLLRKVVLLIAVLFFCFSSVFCFSAVASIPVLPYDHALALQRDEGYLLLNLDVNGPAPSIEFTKVRVSHESYLVSDLKLKKLGNSMRLDLKNTDKGFYLISLPAGVYQITRVNAPYFDLPYQLDIDNSPAWRFKVESNSVNYLGKLHIAQQRSRKYVDVQLLNRMAADFESIGVQLSSVLSLLPLRSAFSIHDAFHENLSNKAH